MAGRVSAGSEAWRSVLSGRSGWVWPLVLATLLVGACGAEEPAAVSPPVTAEASVEGGATSVPADSSLSGSVVSLPDGCGEDRFDRAEFAFEGTVTAIEERSRPLEGEPGEPGFDPDAVAPMSRWVSFEASRWFTTDWGVEFSVWMPTPPVEQGQEWLVGGNAFWVLLDDFEGQSGEVDVCLAEPATEASGVAWDAALGGAVVPGVNEPEGVADPVAVGELRAAQQRWRESEPESYAVQISRWDRSTVYHRGCHSDGGTRVVVVGGEVVQAVNPLSDCVIDPATVPSVDEVFDRAIALASATEFDYRLDDDPTLVTFTAYDRSVDASGRVWNLTPEAQLASSGWEDVSAAVAEGRRRWSDAPIADYELSVNIGMGGVPFRLTVEDGEAIELNGETTHLDDLERLGLPLTIEMVYESIDEMAGEGHATVVMSPDGRYPTYLWVDRWPRAIDDESEWIFTVTEHPVS